MRKLILIFIFVFLLFQFIDVDAFECKIKDNCASNENLILYMYDNVDSHVANKNSNVNWPKKLCCTELKNECSGLYKEIFRLHLSKDGHVSTINTQYPQPICLSVYDAQVGQGNIECSLKSSCDGNAGEQCVITLSSNDDAHVSECNVAGSYNNNQLCCKATKCQSDFVWDPLSNNGKGACVFQPFECSQGGKVCVGIPPYTKPKDLCVITEPIPYERACCLATTFENKDYYKYYDVVVKKRTL